MISIARRGDENVSVHSEEAMAEEFYPELLAVIINLLDESESSFHVDENAFMSFNTLVNRALFHIAKHSTLQLVLEEIGWYISDTKVEDILEGLKDALVEIYMLQITQCVPCGICGPSDLKVEQHPDLFNDQVATYSYLPNILLHSLLQDARNSTSIESLQFEGACMLADISGFTKLSGACCEEGTSGLDRLHDACSGYLGKFVQTVYTYQGDGKYAYCA